MEEPRRDVPAPAEAPVDKPKTERTLEFVVLAVTGNQDWKAAAAAGCWNAEF
jgi:hypothetical protein